MGYYDFYKGETFLYKGADKPEPQMAIITTHIDNRAYPNLQWSDWVSEFGYGYSSYPPQPYERHKGIDLYSSDRLVYSPPFWTNILDMGYSSSMGNYMILEPSSSNNQRIKNYAIFRMMHFEYLNDRVFIGGEMEPGGFVGLQGNTGRSDGEHLHFDTFMHGSYVDSYPYVFDVHENGFEGWDTFVTTGHWVCEQEKIGEVIHKERLVAVAKDNESAKNYGLVSLSIRKNDIRKQEDLNSLAEETLQAKKQIGFNRSINIAISDSNLTLLDKIKVNNVPFMNEGEEAEIVGIDFDLLNPSKDEITLDNNKFSYIGLMKGGVKL